MVFIIGGAYQGKLDYAKEKYELAETDIHKCGEGMPDFAKTCIYGIQEFTYACIQKGIEPLDVFKERRSEWENSILICDDMFCGVVPLGADMREWRQATGRLCKYLSQEAASVTRIFCGLEQKLK